MWLDHNDKINNVSQVDKFVCAELPDEHTQPRLFDIVKRNMIHKCGDKCKKTVNGVTTCTKHYKKDYCEETYLNRKGFYVYRRRNNGRCFTSRGQIYDIKKFTNRTPG